MKNEAYRDKKEELNYFGSDYNKFLNTECSKEMTVVNFDCVQFKRSKGIIRIIESKHDKEKIPESQREILNIFAMLFRWANKYAKKYKFEVYIIKGNYPYDNVRINDLVNGVTYLCRDRNKFKDFSEFKLSVTEIADSDREL